MYQCTEIYVSVLEYSMQSWRTTVTLLFLPGIHNQPRLAAMNSSPKVAMAVVKDAVLVNLYYAMETEKGLKA